ncbi:MAG: TraU family protein [Candidatus Thiodiazotropha endolucinida]|nr:TraU family protein [Candidatus Thiodiazotropha endolucinida]
MIRRRVVALFFSVVLWLPVTGFTGTTTTPQIITQTTAGALMCMRWMPTGVCFWLRCSWSGCSVRTSIKVGHYNPDLDQNGDPPALLGRHQ